MKCAILGNGPSRKLYTGSIHYDYKIGTNIPWTEVNSTVVMDVDIIIEWKKNKDLIKYPVYFSDKAWAYADTLKFREYILDKDLFLGMFEVPREDSSVRYSSGHCAAIKAIELGYKDLDLYGFDSYFSDTVESYTREFVKDSPANNSQRWTALWKRIIFKNKDVTFNFIRE